MTTTPTPLNTRTGLSACSRSSTPRTAQVHHADKPLVFLDIETAGLHPSAVIWEVALIRRDPGEAEDVTYEWITQDPDMRNADPKALELTRFHDRYRHALRHGRHKLVSAATLAGLVYEVTRGAVLVANNPTFDVPRLERLLRAHGYCPDWHYKPVDVTTLLAGALYTGGPAPALTQWHKSHTVSAGAFVDPPTPDEAHSALADARWVIRMWDAAMEHFYGVSPGE